MLVTLNVNFPAITGATTEELYIPIAQKGRWRIIGASFAADTTAAAGDGTNNANVTLATNDGAGGAFTVQSTLSGNGTAYTVGTTRNFVFASQVEVRNGYQVRIAKTVTGTGGTIAGLVSIALEKIGN